MPSDELSVPITEGRFRERRAYLSPEAFADPGDGNHTPTNLIDCQVWMELMDLATDVLLQTTDHFGPTFRATRSLSHMWISGIMPDGTNLPLVFDAYLDAYDEFEAAPFIAAHGWYRQATAGLRNVLEVMAHAARFAIRDEPDGYAAWRDGTTDWPRFANSVDLVGQAPSVAAVESTLPAGGLFGRNPRRCPARPLPRALPIRTWSSRSRVRLSERFLISGCFGHAARLWFSMVSSS